MSSKRPKRLSLEIRLATAEDAPSISSVLFQSFIEYKSAYTPEGFAATCPGVEQIKHRLNEGPVWVGLADGAIIATVSAIPQGESLYIRGMAVLPEARGLRIGELLMTDVEKFAHSRGCRRLFLSTPPFLSAAIALYERLGFNRTGAGPHDLHGTPLFTMERAFEPKA
ncbi:MAG: GNAT family N-acetyltransferase [Pyrinomonadaceae bacterium]